MKNLLPSIFPEIPSMANGTTPFSHNLLSLRFMLFRRGPLGGQMRSHLSKRSVCPRIGMVSITIDKGPRIKTHSTTMHQSASLQRLTDERPARPLDRTRWQSFHSPMRRCSMLQLAALPPYEIDS